MRLFWVLYVIQTEFTLEPLIDYCFPRVSAQLGDIGSQGVDRVEFEDVSHAKTLNLP